MPSVAPNSLSAASASLYDIPKPGCTALGSVEKVAVSSKISWPKNCSSWAACALLKAIAAAMSPPASGTPDRVAKYFLRSIWKSKSRTTNSGFPEKISPKCGNVTSTRVAPALWIADSASSKTASSFELNPSNSRATPMPAAARPAAGGREAAKVGPLAQGGLAENDGAGGAQLGGHRGVTGRRRSYQAQRTGSRLHAVPGIDVVFEHDGDAVQWTAHTSSSALRVQLQRDGLSIRIDFDDRVYFGSLLIERGDARLIEVHQGDRVQLARSHGRLQIGDGGFGRVARGRDLRPRRADGPPFGEGRGGSRERTQLKEDSPTQFL